MTELREAVYMDAQDLVGKGLYSPAEAARLIRTPARKVRRWLFGVKDHSHGRRRNLSALTDAAFKLSSGDYMTFEGFIELLAIRAFRNAGVSMATIRLAHEAAKRRFSVAYPFASRQFFTDGKVIFADLKNDLGSEEVEALEDLARSQLAFERVIAPTLKNIDFSEDSAARYWPLGHGVKVVIDSRRYFGKPIDPDTGVPTSVLANAYKAEKGNVSVVARWYSVSEKALHDAVSYESELATAA